MDSLDGRHKLLARSLDFDGVYTWRAITGDGENGTDWVDRRQWPGGWIANWPWTPTLMSLLLPTPRRGTHSLLLLGDMLRDWWCFAVACYIMVK